MGGRLGGVVVVLALVAACATGPRAPEPGLSPPTAPTAATPDRTAAQFADLQTTYPALADYAVWFRLRAAARAGDRSAATTAANDLVALRPTIWEGPAALTMGLLEEKADAPESARGWLELARATNRDGGQRWSRATLALAEVLASQGEAERALALADDVRRARPRSLSARRARRLEERIRRTRPDLPSPSSVDEAERALREGDRARARRMADAALASGASGSDRARALWTRANAERGDGDRAAADATCLLLARSEPDDELAPRALSTAARWRWNADDDEGAYELYRELTRRFPSSPQVVDAYYAIARIQQESGHHAQALATYEELARRYPRATVADDARWRAAWVRYQAGQYAAAERAFAALAASRSNNLKIAAEYWRARTLERLGKRDDARARYGHVAEEHPTSYYADLAEARLGREPEPVGDPVAPPPPPFPAGLAGPHAERARALQTLGLLRLARREIDAARDAGAPPELILDAYEAIGARGPAIRLARTADPEDVTAILYPLGYWDLVLPASRSRGLDPLFVSALIRQESLFDPEAVSPANAHGLMQLLPSTANRVSASLGTPPPRNTEALHQPSLNVELGTALLASLMQQYGGSRAKVLAAYNAGEDAVAKWERRYAGRDMDEFVELISYRETRDYVKSVLSNYRRYKQLYAASA
jgi:soluble lytic murein transglycosylase